MWQAPEASGPVSRGGPLSARDSASPAAAASLPLHPALPPACPELLPTRPELPPTRPALLPSSGAPAAVSQPAPAKAGHPLATLSAEEMSTGPARCRDSSSARTHTLLSVGDDLLLTTTTDAPTSALGRTRCHGGWWLTAALCTLDSGSAVPCLTPDLTFQTPRVLPCH